MGFGVKTYMGWIIIIINWGEEVARGTKGGIQNSMFHSELIVRGYFVLNLFLSVFTICLLNLMILFLCHYFYFNADNPKAEFNPKEEDRCDNK